MVIAAATVVVIGAITTGVVTVLGAFAKMKVEVLSKVAAVDVKADQIAQSVNGTASAAVVHRTALEDKITSLHEQLLALQTKRIADANHP